MDIAILVGLTIIAANAVLFTALYLKHGREPYDPNNFKRYGGDEFDPPPYSGRVVILDAHRNSNLKVSKK